MRESDVDTCEAVVRAEPHDVLLWLWNRAGDDVVTTTGDAELVAYLRKVLAAGTGWPRPRRPAGSSSPLIRRPQPWPTSERSWTGSG